MRFATLAAWILALFPDGVLLGGSQMREPFLIALLCIAFWAVLDWQKTPIKSLVISVTMLGFSCLFSVPAGGVFAAILASTVVLEWSLSQKKPLRRNLGLAALAVVAVGALGLGWLWLRSTLYYDSYTTMTQSGIIQDLFRFKLDPKFLIPFTSVYGLTQPLLPAALTDSAVAIWKTIAILRALGWYMALPILLFAFFASFATKEKGNKWLVASYILIFLLWVIVSSARAGGDLWDNPRYRYILLPLMALIISWAVDHYRTTRTPWFWRWIAVVANFVIWFLIVYIGRVNGHALIASFFIVLLLIFSITAFILVGGWIWDRVKLRRKGQA